MFVDALIALARLFGAEQLSYPIRQLSGGSFRTFTSRLFRLRRLARAMADADPSPPLPVRLQIETTDICNMKCVMCTREVMDGMNTMTMSLEQFTKTVESMAPYYVTLNGLGEPLIDQTIFDKLDFLHRRGIVTAMPTNGTYVRGERLEKLAANLPDNVTFSIDGATKSSYEQIRVLGNFEQSIGNYRALLELRRDGKTRPNTRIQVLFVLQKGNLRDFRGMYELRAALPRVDSLSIVPFFDYDAEGRSFSHLVPSPEEVADLHRELLPAIEAAATRDEREFLTAWKTVSEQWLALDSGPQIHTGSCLVPWFSTYIDAKGAVFPCCYLMNSKHILGNINDAPFPEIWHGPGYQTFRNSLVTSRKDLAGCRTCPKNDDGPLVQLRRFRPLL